MAAPKGICRLCGVNGPLSFDHVPPKKAFNDHKVLMVSRKQAWERMPGDPMPKGREQQRGMGEYSLCAKCNSRVGRWYGDAFVKFVYQAASLLEASEGKPTLIHRYHCFPLRVIKQIVAMFFSVNGSWLRESHPELETFILWRWQQHLSPRYRIFLYYNYEGEIRMEPFMGKLHILSSTKQHLSEITFPPLGYMFTIDSLPPREVELFEISHFARYGYEEYDAMQLRLPVLPSWSPVPGDYPTRDEFVERVKRNTDAAD